MAMKEAEEKSRQEAEETAKKEAEEKSKKEAQEKAQKEVEAKAAMDKALADIDDLFNEATSTEAPEAPTPAPEQPADKENKSAIEDSGADLLG